MKYKYRIQNLDCANCAREVEEFLTKDGRMDNVIVNFNTGKLSFEAKTEIQTYELNQLVQKVEPEAVVSEIATESASSKYSDEKCKGEKYTGEKCASENYADGNSINGKYADEKVEASEGETKSRLNQQGLLLALGLIIGGVAYFLPFPELVKILGYVIAYGLLLYQTGRKAIKTLIKSHSVNEDTLITISGVGALMIGEILEGMMVITLYTIGKMLETKALNNSRSSIKSLINIKQPFAQRKQGEKLERVRVEEVRPNDRLIIKKGERVPVDGELISDKAELDLATLTGESDEVKVRAGEKVLSGAINLGETFEMRATTNYENSTVAKILELLEDATDRKAKTETVVAKISKFYTPVILVLSILVSVILPIAFRVPVMESVYRGLTFLVIACPCAIAISVPLSYFTGVGTASKHGILVKGSNYFDNLSNAKKIIFDKTGTLTDGSFAVSEIKIADKKYTEAEVIEILAQGEALSTHPIAQSILKLYPGKLEPQRVKHFQEKAGEGISYSLNGKEVKVGNKLICPCQEDAVLHLNIDGKHVASITINDGIKTGAEVAVVELKQMKMTAYMFTGDKNSVARVVAKKIGISQVRAEMLPTDKFRAYEKVSEDGAMTIFVGDGINDAPVLKRADIGIAMGGVGSESAIEAADVVIMNDDLRKIPQVMRISRYTRQIIYQNLVFAIGVKIIILVLSVLGLANMWWAVFADTGVTLLAILNTLRIMYRFR